MKKRFLALMLAIVMILGCINFVYAESINTETHILEDEIISGQSIEINSISSFADTVSTDNVTESQRQDIILVLDDSGSMSTGDMDALKEASVKFCETVFKANSANRVGIYAFSKGIKCDLTSNIDELIATINDLYDSGGTPLDTGIATADSMFEDLWDNDTIKSMVIMSDGAPNSEKRAKAAYDNIADKYKVYSVYFGNSSSESSFMESIQNSGFYNATDVDSLIDNFGKIAEVILYPFEVSFRKNLYQTTDENGNIISDGTIKINSNGSYEYVYTYKIEAYIINKNTNYITNAKVTLNLADGMNLAENETLIKEFSHIAEYGTAEWIIEIPYLSYTESKNLDFSISIEADNMEKRDYSTSIYVEAMNIKDNRLNTKKDIWNFENYVISSSNEVLSEEKKDIILYGLNNAFREYLLEKMNSVQDGQCFGMATMAILNKVGNISPSDIGKENRDLYSLQKDEENVKGWINFYFLTQYQPAYSAFKKEFQKVDEYNKIAGKNGLGIFTKEFIEFENKLVTEQLKELETKANAVKNGGAPVYIGFQFDQAAHGIVGYDVEYDNYYKCGSNYNARVITYDCNYPNGNEDSYVYFNTGTNEWCIPEYNHAPIGNSIIGMFKTICTGANNEDGHFTSITNDINLLDSNNMTEKTNAYKNSVLWINHINEMNSIQTNGIYIKENGQLNKYFPGEYATGITLDSKDSPSYTVYLADSNDNVIKVDDNSAVDVSLMYEDYYATASSTKSNGVSFKNDGAVAITGNSGDYTIGLTANDGYTSLPWYTVKVSGTGEAQNPSLTNTSEGYVFEGESLKNIQVLANNDDETKELTFDSDKTSVLITNDNDNLIVKEDTDNDGIYDKIIADSDNKTGEITTETTTEVAPIAKSSHSSGAGASSISVKQYNDVKTESLTEAVTVDNTEEATTEISGLSEVKVTIGSSIVSINGTDYNIDAAPYIQAESNSTLVPLRFVALAIAGGDVSNADNSENISWDAETKTATVTAGSKVIKFTAGSDTMIVDGKSIVMENGVKAEITDGRMYVPFRALGNALGVNVDWDADTKTAIYKNK